MHRLFLHSIAILSIGLCGCGTAEFNGDTVKGMLEGSPVKLAGEQVTLTPAQLECGVQNELWDPPSNNIARLEQKGRNLKFSDDVRIGDPEVHVPYTQISGDFPVAVSDVGRLSDGDNGTKLAEVRLGVTIANDCFTSPLPLMGIRKGKFSPDAPVVFRFQGGGKDWTLDKLVH